MKIDKSIRNYANLNNNFYSAMKKILERDKFDNKNKKKMTDIKIEFKQTTYDKFKCASCGGKISGVDGFVKVATIRNANSVYAYQENKISLCNKCFGAMYSKIEDRRENKEDSYKKLVKKAILKKL